MKLIEYHRGSTDEQLLTLDAQATQTAAYITMMGYETAGAHVDHGVSTRKAIENRPELARALKRLEAGEADGMVATKVDRVSRNTGEFLKLVDLFQKRGWSLVVLNLGVDTTTPAGRLIATVLAALAEWERGEIGERTRAALAVKASQGVVLGARAHKAPKLVTDDALAMIRQLADTGLSTRRIAKQLDQSTFKPPRGGRSWSHTTVAAVLSPR